MSSSRKTYFLWASLCAAFLLFPLFVSATEIVTGSDLPLRFVENRGQLDGPADFYLPGADRTLYFAEGGITLSLDGDRPWAARLEFVGARSGVKPEGEGLAASRHHFFRGARDAWVTGVRSYGRVVYRDLWPGIDLVYDGEVKALKYSFIVKPGADPSRIGLVYRGVDGLSVKPDGALEIRVAGRVIEDGVPVAYQDVAGERMPVDMAFRLDEDGSNRFGFTLGEYDPTQPLVMDPIIVHWCSFLGGSGSDYCYDLARDGAGDLYLTGYTTSSETSFPVKVGPKLVKGGGDEIFVAKVKGDGSDIVYCGYIGGSQDDEGRGISVDSAGCAYITGVTESDETTFPVLVGPDLTYNGTSATYYDAFVAKVSADGSSLVYCGYIGGERQEKGTCAEVDASGRLHVAGLTNSSEATFPVLVGPDLTLNGSTSTSDAFVARVAADGTALEYCGYIGGSNTDDARDLALDAAGCVVVVGRTRSKENYGFPVLVGPDLTHNSGYDSYVAKVKADGTGLVYCGYIGGSSDGCATAVALDAAGAPIIAGYTEEDEATFPVLVGPRLVHTSQEDGYVAKVKADGTALEYCGYIGGDQQDWAYAVAVDSTGAAYVGGTAESGQASFPVKVGPALKMIKAKDAFLAKVLPDGSDFAWCGFIGGSYSDEIRGIVLADNEDPLIAGFTIPGSTFPVSNGFDMTTNGSTDAFVGHVSSDLVDDFIAEPTTLSQAVGGVVEFTLHPGLDNRQRNYLIFGGVTGSAPGTPLPGGYVTLPINWDLFTNFIIAMANSPVFPNFLGPVDNAGNATAKFDTPGPHALGRGPHAVLRLRHGRQALGFRVEVRDRADHAVMGGK